ncbi:hypothetical protein [Leisingera aquimarina]|uniref:hypothetical protein n=1 Tax=Leisingera aquimarina TaxID=476529 RepID=UPI0012EBA96F|nr:hypothetical protein [Leisingera aquimarina]
MSAMERLQTMASAFKIKSEAAPGLTIAQTIALTDALTFQDNLSTASVGGLFTDPPYSSGGSNRLILQPTWKKYTGKSEAARALPDFAGETMDQRSNLRFTLTWTSAARRVLDCA